MVLPSFLAEERSRVFLVEEKVGVWETLPLLLALLLVLRLGLLGVVSPLHADEAVDFLEEVDENEESRSLFLEVALFAALLVGVGLAARASDLRDGPLGSVSPRGRVLGTPMSPWELRRAKRIAKEVGIRSENYCGGYVFFVENDCVASSSFRFSFNLTS